MKIEWEQRVRVAESAPLSLVAACCQAAEGVALPLAAHVVVTDDAEIRALNARTRGVDRATDVLSFPLGQDGVYDRNLETGALQLGDIVISTDAVQHDMDVRIFGYPLGEIPQMGVLSFPADEHLAEVAEEVCKEVNPEIQVFRGRVVSGDQFISSKEVKNHLIEEFNGSCAEMEGAAIAQGAYLNKIPYVVLRAISDKADDSATMDYPTFESEAARHCVNLLQEMVKRL